MAWKIFDFKCVYCGWEGEELFKDSEDNILECPECNCHLLPETTFPHIGAFSAASSERQREILRTRSERHTQKEVEKEPERWGSAGIRRARQNKKPMVGYKK